jgi:LytS/YehU family sensor histidine kinase
VIRARVGLAILLALAACQIFGLEPLIPESRTTARRAGIPSVPGLGLALLTAAGGGAAVYFLRARRREMRERRRTALAESQLDALKFQLRPHFLFNTLHTLLPLVDKDPDRARSMVVRLGDLLRLSLQAEERPLVTLEEEVGILESYLSIEQVRFRDRLDVSIRVEPEAAAAAVPSFLLQPLVENSLEHGRSGARGRIVITARIDGPELAIVVGNDAADVAAPTRTGVAEGPGLSHTRRRLEALYPGRHRLELLPAAGVGAEIRVRIPLVFVGPSAIAV